MGGVSEHVQCGTKTVEPFYVSQRMGIGRFKRDGPCAETRFRLSELRTSPFESAGVSAQ
jgi:hypothetical protein